LNSEVKGARRAGKMGGGKKKSREARDVEPEIEEASH
jgi:hypothetical protein